MDAKLLKPSGIVSTYALDEDPSRQPALNLQQLASKDITVHFVLVYAMSRARHEKAITDLNTTLRLGALRPRVARRFRLDDIAEAHELLGTAGVGGKVSLDIE